MNIAWVAHLPEDKKEGFKQLILNSNRDPVLMRLRDIIIQRRKSIESSEIDPKNYANSSWAYLQAHNNGMRQALQFIETLLTFKD